ncbi:solute carrier family 35 member G1-like [Apostichopus japonicus]|uniref:solute carrier family 35 member G1-like n=1 Tax=Stichopus japonicus TaxID=307972 RepID=UPI003AB4C6A9
MAIDKMDQEKTPLRTGETNTQQGKTKEDQRIEKRSFPLECLKQLYEHSALLYSLLSASCAVIVDISVFKAGQHMPAIEIPLWNAVGITLLSLIAIPITRPALPRTLSEIAHVLIGGFLVGTGSMLLLLAIVLASPGDAITLYFTMPVFTTLLGALFFKEVPSCLQVVLVVLAVLGVTLVSGPTFLFSDTTEKETEKNYLYGLMLAIASAVVTSSGLVAYRQLSKKHETLPYLPILLQGISGLTISAILCGLYVQFTLPKTVLDTVVITSNGFLSFCSGMAIYFALKLANASYVTIAMTSEVLLAFIAQYLFFNLLPTWNSVIGAIVITITCIGLTLIHQCDSTTQENQDQTAPLLQLE